MPEIDKHTEILEDYEPLLELNAGTQRLPIWQPDATVGRVRCSPLITCRP